MRGQTQKMRAVGVPVHTTFWKRQKHKDKTNQWLSAARGGEGLAPGGAGHWGWCSILAAVVGTRLHLSKLPHAHGTKSGFTE